MTPSLTTKCLLNQPYFDSKYWLNVYTITFSLRMLTCCCFYYSCQCVEHIASNSTDWLRRWNEQLLRNTKVDEKKCCCFYQQTRLKSEFHWMNTPLIATEVFFRYKKKTLIRLRVFQFYGMLYILLAIVLFLEQKKWSESFCRRAI